MCFWPEFEDLNFRALCGLLQLATERKGAVSLAVSMVASDLKLKSNRLIL
jgi:hypothetical protein